MSASGAATAVASAAAAATSAVRSVKDRAAQVAPASPDVAQLASGAGDVISAAGQKVKDVKQQVAGAAGQASSQAANAVEGVLDHAVQQKYRLEKLAEHFSELMEGFLKRKMYMFLKILIDKVPGIIKYALEDPEMPNMVKRAQDAAVDAVWPDVEQEILWELAVGLDGRADEQLPEATGPICCRAFLRYHLYPYDRGFWGRLRDPVWILFTLVGLIPVYGISPAVFLFIFLLIDKSDEFQLVSFILEFKGFQYLTQGVVRSVMGYFMYLNCVSVPGDLEKCVENGPGSETPVAAVLAGYSIQILLVWISFLILPFSSRKGRSTLTGQLDGPEPSRLQGGYLLYLLWYDLLTFVICAASFVYVLQQRNWLLDDWIIEHAFFAIQMVHGYLSMPFYFFTLPLLRNVLTHAAPTAYDRYGRCRKYIGFRPPADSKPQRLALPSVLEKAEAARVLENLKRLLSGGRVRALDVEEPPSRETE
mmetsp:Transcript_6638/g.15382  ORF Transcript_6638/g.15382 Transcript_6638/m.15382 type:complete len:478 (-) Transcript_6638:136-1569(-)